MAIAVAAFPAASTLDTVVAASDNSLFSEKDSKKLEGAKTRETG
jgi:hypothetical protein